MPLAPRGYSAMGTTIAGTDTAGTIKVAAFFAEIVNIGSLVENLEKIETTYSALSAGSDAKVGATFVPGDIVTSDDLDIEVLHDPQKVVPFGVPEVIVITLPKRGTATTAATKTFTGFLTRHEVTFPLKGSHGVLTKCKLCVSGRIVHAPAA
ncbi:MAG: hypothetical protein EBR82_18300 [Caulobacteraceae bacterium]|nr:hypothetical protein [Caulobacteraceae bacterium]